MQKSVKSKSKRVSPAKIVVHFTCYQTPTGSINNYREDSHDSNIYLID